MTRTGKGARQCYLFAPLLGAIASIDSAQAIEAAHVERVRARSRGQDDRRGRFMFAILQSYVVSLGRLGLLDGWCNADG